MPRGVLNSACSIASQSLFTIGWGTLLKAHIVHRESPNVSMSKAKSITRSDYWLAIAATQLLFSSTVHLGGTFQGRMSYVCGMKWDDHMGRDESLNCRHFKCFCVLFHWEYQSGLIWVIGCEVSYLHITICKYWQFTAQNAQTLPYSVYAAQYFFLCLNPLQIHFLVLYTPGCFGQDRGEISPKIFRIH